MTLNKQQKLFIAKKLAKKINSQEWHSEFEWGERYGIKQAARALGIWGVLKRLISKENSCSK